MLVILIAACAVCIRLRWKKLKLRRKGAHGSNEHYVNERVSNPRQRNRYTSDQMRTLNETPAMQRLRFHRGSMLSRGSGTMQDFLLHDETRESNL